LTSNSPVKSWCCFPARVSWSWDWELPWCVMSLLCRNRCPWWYGERVYRNDFQSHPTPGVDEAFSGKPSLSVRMS